MGNTPPLLFYDTFNPIDSDMFPVIPVIVLGVASAIGLRHHIKKGKANRSTVDNLTTWLESMGLPKDTPVDGCLPNGNPLLIEATRLQYDRIVAALIKARASVNIMNAEGKTALFYASSVAVAKALVDAGVLVDARDIHGKTALFYVKKPEILSYLISMGADLNVVDEQGDNILYSYKDDDAHSDDILQCVRILLKVSPLLKNGKCTHNYSLKRIFKNVGELINTELQNAVKVSDIQKIELYLHELSVVSFINYNSLFGIAIDNRQLESISFLSKYHSTLTPSYTQVSKLMDDISGSKDVAERQRFLACLKLLLDIESRFTSYILLTCYDDAIELNDPELIELLSQYKRKQVDSKRTEKSKRPLRCDKNAKSTAPCDQLSNGFASKSIKRKRH